MLFAEYDIIATKTSVDLPKKQNENNAYQKFNGQYLTKDTTLSETRNLRGCRKKMCYNSNLSNQN